MNELEAGVGCTSDIIKRIVSLVQETASTHTNPPEDEGVTSSVAEGHWLCIGILGSRDRHTECYFCEFLRVTIW